MKAVFGLLLFSSFALAHGPVAEQGSEAVRAATKMFLSSQPKEMTRQFQSVFADMTGHEQFKVVFTLKDGKEFTYACMENEISEPVVWECE